MVCLSASPTCRRVIHAAARMAEAASLPLTGIYIGKNTDSAALLSNISYAMSFHASICRIDSSDVALQISEYARKKNVSDLFIGSSAPTGLFPYRKPFSQQLAELLPDIDIHVIPDAKVSPFPEIRMKTSGSHGTLRDILLLIAIMAAATLLSYWFYGSPYSNANIITIYILAVLITSVLTAHVRYGIIAALLYILLFNYLFIEPRFSLLVYDPEYMVTYFVTIVAALITSSLAARMKNVAHQFAENAYQAKVLLETSNQLQQASSSTEIMRITCRQLVILIQRTLVCYTVSGTSPGEPELFRYPGSNADDYSLEKEKDAVLWTTANNHHSGAFTDRFPECRFRYLSVYSSDRTYGVIGVDMKKGALSEFENSLLLAVISECAMALDNEQKEKARQEAEIVAGNEHFRASLLRSVSHDLRTPLTSIYGNAETLITSGKNLAEADRHLIYEDIYDESVWLSEQMENILTVTKLESDSTLNMSVENVRDIIEESLRHIDRHHNDSITVEDIDDFLFICADTKLIIQVLINLISNAIRHTPDGTDIRISAYREEDLVWISVADNGPGIPDEEKENIFGLFYTGSHSVSDSQRSLGIGLNMCRAIMEKHGQQIIVEDNKPNGSIFRISLEAKEVAPL